MNELTYAELKGTQKDLLSAAAEALHTAYAPYSHFSVGAALLTSNGQIIIGSNVENAAYGSSICAERVVIWKANSLGIRTFDALAIMGKGNGRTTDVVAPCGSCRQVLYEFSHVSEKNLDIFMATPEKDKVIIATIEELLPFAFGPKHLGVEVQKYRKGF